MAKISLKKAVKGLTPFDLSSVHITTSDFGMPQVCNIFEVVPDDTFHINMSAEARVAPMVVPTFMDVKLVTRSFFVPMSAIYKSFEYFYTDRQDSSTYKTFPTITNAEIVFTFLNDSSLHFSAQESQTPDFVVGNDSYIFSDKGRWFYKLLLSLGYGINFNTSDTTAFSILPLVAYLRVVYDYLYPSQYVDSLGITQLFVASSSSDYTNYSSKVISGILASYNLPFRQDYFTGAWKDINMPGSSQQNITITNPISYTGGTAEAQSNSNLGSVTFTGTKYVNYVSQFALNNLQRLYDFVTRNNIAGVRFADQIFARFGLGSAKSDPDMSRFIKSHEQNVQVYDVTAFTSAPNQELGELAGKGYVDPQNSGSICDFSSDGEFGYIILISHIEPRVGYYQGRKRHTLHTTRFDFYTPEFDMQMRAIRNDELFADYKDSASYTSGQNYGGSPNGVFGFAPNYSEYKKRDDYLTGDFRIPSLSRNLDSYHLFRDIPIPSPSAPLSLASSFLFCKQNQFDKIFSQIMFNRFDISTTDFNGRQIMTLNGKIAQITASAVGKPNSASSTETFYVYFEIQESRTYRQLVPFISSTRLGSNLSYYEVPFNDSASTWSRSTSGQMVRLTQVFSFFGQPFSLSMTTLTSVTTWTDPSTIVWLYDGTVVLSSTVLYDFDKFLSRFSSYIDHFYIKYFFDVKATRPMQPISEEFMISDGGESLEVSLNGNRLN